MKLTICKTVLLSFAAAIFTLTASAQDASPIENIVFPAGVGIINVTAPPYNADNTGATDATAALQAAIDVAKGNLKGKIVYLPNGTYLVSSKLVFCTDAAIHRGMIFQGQSRQGTILKLADSIAPSNVNLPVIKCVDGPVFQNSMFNCSVLNMTVDIGSGNPGAVGINYLASNEGTVRNVLIRSGDATKSGRFGLEITYNIPGPAMIKNVTIDGFDYGIRSSRLQYGMTFENITLSNQKIAGLRNDAQTLSIRHLQSNNSVPAIQQVAGGQSKGIITLIDSELKNGDPSINAIQLDDGFLFARNITTSGYASAIRSGGVAVAGSYVEEFANDNTRTIFPSAARSLNLPINETPEMALEDTSAWVSVRTFGAIPGDGIDDTQGIQNAMNSGASTIYFPNPNNSDLGSRYDIRGTITVGGNVKRLLGLYTGMYPNAAFRNSSLPMFKFVDGGQDTVMMEGFRTAASGARCHFIEQASSKVLIFRNISIRSGFGYRNTGFGDVYMEDFHSLPANIAYDSSIQQPGLVFKNQRVWARQLNPEQNQVNIINDGGTVWILGLKSEYPNTLIETRNGGKTELLGGLTVTIRAWNKPAFINNNSSVSIAGFGEARSRSVLAVYADAVVETRGTVTDTLKAAGLLTRKAEQDNSLSFVLPLYVGYPSVQVPLPLQLLSFKAGLLTGSFGPQVKAEWLTTNERNTDEFVVERSAGVAFKAVGTIPAKNTTGTHAYSLLDVQPLVGISYYRLKQMDIDGKTTYSKVVTVRNTSAINLNVSPNPASASISVLHPVAGDKATIRIVHSSGRTEMVTIVSKGAAQTSRLNIAGLAAGHYIVVFENGTDRITGKFVKGR